ncbi:MAG: S-layer family protein, partial [Cyanobacteria bacterium P01_A01_bin.40]
LNVVQLPQKTSTRKALIISNCPVPKANTFAVTGLGGIPENPSSYLRGRTLWQDARRLTDNADSNSLPNPTSSHSQQKKTSRSKSPIVSTNTIIESQAWIINRQGNVELVAAVTPKIGQQGIGCDDL